MNMTREIPISYGKNDFSEIKLTYNVIFTNYILSTLFSLLILFLIWLLDLNTKLHLDGRLIVFCAFIFLSSNVLSFLNSYIKAEGEYITYGKFEVVNSLIDPLSKLCLVYFIGLNGALASIVITNVIGSIYIYLSLDKPSFDFHLSKIKTMSLLKTGSIMFFCQILDGFLLSLPILITTYYFTSIEVGLMSFAFAIVSSKSVPFSKAIIVTTIRKMSLVYGKLGNKSNRVIRKFFQKDLTLFLLVSTLIVGVFSGFKSYCLFIFTKIRGEY